MSALRLALYLGFGITIEGYDYAIYALLAKHMSVHFFGATAENLDLPLLFVFGILVIGNLVRPVSGLLVGFLGDRRGRKKMVTHTLLGMTLSTLAIGCIPSYQRIGWLAGLLLALCRILQNWMMGGDFPGAVTMLLESIKRGKRGLYFGIMFGMLGFGSSLAAGVIALLNKLLTTTQMNLWGWRIPFLFSVVLGLVGVVLRYSLPETPEFLARCQTTASALQHDNECHQRLQPSTTPVRFGAVLHQIWRPSLLVIGMTMAPLAISLFKTILPTCLEHQYHYPPVEIYLALSMAYFSSGFAKLLFGWISDRLGTTAVAASSSLLLLLGTLPMFALLRLHQYTWPLYLFIFYLQIVTSLSAASMSMLAASAFPVTIRFAGLGFSSNMANLLAAFVPLIAQLNYSSFRNDLCIIIGFLLLALLSLYCIWSIKHQPNRG